MSMKPWAAALCFLIAFGFPVSGQPAPETDYFKEAGNFLENCDPRRNAEGERPEPDYLCLSFVTGLLEGYTYAAIANGNARPYCLPRPASLAELMDMMVTAIERGVPPDFPTAAVLHFILTVNFSCNEETPSGETAN